MLFRSLRSVSRLAALIPPKIASPSAIGASQSAARMTRVVDFYSKVRSSFPSRPSSALTAPAAPRENSG